MVQLISNFMLAITKSQVSACFLVHSIETHVFNHSTHICNLSTCVFDHSTRVFNHSTCMFKFVFDRHRFTSVCSSFNSNGMHYEYITSSDSLLRVLTSSSHALYLSSSNSPVKVRIGKHICKGRGLILLVTGPARINHLSANYTEFYFS